MSTTKTISLADTPEAQFRKYVDKDLRAKAPYNDSEVEQVALGLRSAPVVDRWFSVLLTMSKSVEGQLAARKIDWSATRMRLTDQIERGRLAGDAVTADKASTALLEERTKYLAWRANTIRFKTGLDERLAEARHLRDRFSGSDASPYEQANENLKSRVRHLEDAIRKHRTRVLDDGLDDAEHDQADEDLWALVT